MPKITIRNYATAADIEMAETSENIPVLEKGQLIAMMRGHLQYAPLERRVIGPMESEVKCGSACCENVAMGRYATMGGTWGSPRCPIHRAYYLHKLGEALTPRCNRCNTVTNNVYETRPTCVTCAQVERAIEATNRAESSYTAIKAAKLDSAFSVDQLRDWIKEYML